MLPIVLCVLAVLGFITGIAIWLTRRSDRTVINRMHSPDRADLTRDPRAYIHHSSY